MKSRILVSVVTLFTLCFLSGSPAGAQTWLASIDEGLALARRSGKLVLVDFNATWCGWCTKLEKEVFETSAFLNFAKKKLVLVRIDSDEGKETVREYGVRGYPNIKLLQPDGTIVTTISGYRPLNEFMTTLEEAAGSVQTSSEKDSGGDAPKWFDDLNNEAQNLAKRGNRVVLIDCNATWCGWCTKMEKEIYDSPEFRQFANRNLVLVRLDSEEDASTISKLNVTGYPCNIVWRFADGKWSEAGRIKGFKPKSDFLAELERIVVSGNAQAETASIHWVNSFKDAQAEASRRGKIVLAIFFEDGCSDMARMTRETFSNAAFIQAVNADFIPVKVDIAENPQLATLYGAKTSPAVGMYGSSQACFNWVTGYLTTEKFLEELQYAVKKSRK